MTARRGITLSIVAAALGCAAERPTGETAHDSAVSIAMAPPPPEPAMLGTLQGVRVSPFTGPGGRTFEIMSRTAGSSAHLQQQIGMRGFALQLRSGGAGLTQFPCTSCHQGARVTPRAEPAHQNIRGEHPRFAEGACTTCHRASSVDQLALAGGATASLDHAYRLCAQCHFGQVQDWSAGAHGKRLVAWGGRRVVMSCTDCHDPHRPGVDPRVPYPGPRIRRNAGNEP